MVYYTLDNPNVYLKLIIIESLIYRDFVIVPKIIRNELKITGSWNSISAPFPGNEWKTSLKYMEMGLINIKPLITHRIKLDKAPEIFDRLYKREGFFIKTLIEIDK